MNKVTCINGHFFNLDKFSCCPICGGGVAGQSVSRTSTPPMVEPSRQSRVEDMDKTVLLVEDAPAQTPPVSRRPAPPVEPIRQSRVEDMDKTVLLMEDTAEPIPPVSRRPAPTAEPSQQSRLEDTDKTVILFEDAAPKPPVAEKTGIIRWPFGKKEPAAPPREQEPPKRQPDPPVPEVDRTAEARPQPEPGKPDGVERPNESAPTPPASVQPAESPLTQAVAATGHGAFSALPKTVAYYDFAETEPPTGWMVCVQGPYQGQAFPCKAGRNRIGRNPNCDINLLNDAAITREPHAVLIYDPKQKRFYLQNGTGDGLVYLNESLLFSHEQLHAYDKIQMGNSEFVFLPLCGEQFTWDDYIR